MKFENPIMNISMFEVENVVTQASGPAPATSDAAAAEAIAAELAADNTLTITF